MACKKQTVPFKGTPEQEAALKSAIAELGDQPGALMPVMQKAQEIYGYLPIEVQTMISDEMGIPLEKVYGVSTFYAQFALQPKGKYKISVCLGTACYVKGSGEIFRKLEELLGITNGECTACLLYTSVGMAAFICGSPVGQPVSFGGRSLAAPCLS